MKKTIVFIAAASLALVSCRYISVEPSYEGDGTVMPCELDTSIPGSYDGTLASDSDTPGTDPDIYWEANDFSNKIEVDYQGTTAAVTTSYAGVDVKVEGADVTLDFVSREGSNAEVILTGTSENGSVRILSDSRLKLCLSGVQLSRQDGPAVNFQGDQTLFINCPEGKYNVISDGLTYNGEYDIDDDMEGAIFSGGPVIFSGKGSLRVNGNYSHGISTSSYFWLRPGATVAVENACVYGINAMGSDKLDDEGDMLGIMIKGGYIYSRTSVEGASAMYSSTNVKMYGGEACLYTTGDSKYVPDELDICQSVAIEAEQNITIRGGELTAKSSGLGARAIRARDSYMQYDGKVLATSSGKYFRYHNLIGEPKALEAGRNLLLDSGKLDATSSSSYTYSMAITAGKKFTVNGGEAYAYSFDNALQVQDLEVNGGYLFSLSTGADAIDSDNEIVINDGLVEVAATEAAFRNGGGFYIEGGTVLGIYTTSATLTSSQSYGTYTLGISGNTGDVVSVLDGNRTVFSFLIPQSENDSRVIYSSEGEDLDNKCEIYKWGTLSGAESRHRILVEGGTFTGGYYVDTLHRVVN